MHSINTQTVFMSIGTLLVILALYATYFRRGIRKNPRHETAARLKDQNRTRTASGPTPVSDAAISPHHMVEMSTFKDVGTYTPKLRGLKDGSMLSANHIKKITELLPVR